MTNPTEIAVEKVAKVVVENMETQCGSEILEQFNPEQVAKAIIDALGLEFVNNGSEFQEGDLCRYVELDSDWDVIDDEHDYGVYGNDVYPSDDRAEKIIQRNGKPVINVTNIKE